MPIPIWDIKKKGIDFYNTFKKVETMSGHNKWSKIKHKKGTADAKRSKEFSKLVRLISMESKQSDGDSASPSLKMAIDKAKQANMPKDVIERAIQKGNSKDAGDISSVTYEAYGPGGVAIIIEGETDNKNRTGAEVKHLLSSFGAELAAPGSALWAFEKKDGVYEAKNKVPVAGDDKTKLDLITDTLLEQEDVLGVYTNAI